MTLLTTRISCNYVLFDLDGTLVDSTWIISECWRSWAIENHLDPEAVEVLSRGRTAKETISLALPSAINIDELSYGFIKREIQSSVDLTPIAQAREFLQTLPTDSWGVVTSATSALAKARLHAARLPTPRVLVTSESVVKGKPSPDCYIVGPAKFIFQNFSKT